MALLMVPQRVSDVLPYPEDIRPPTALEREGLVFFSIRTLQNLAYTTRRLSFRCLKIHRRALFYIYGVRGANNAILEMCPNVSWPRLHTLQKRLIPL